MARVIQSEKWNWDRPWKARSSWALVTGLVACLIVGVLLIISNFELSQGRADHTFDLWVGGLMLVAVVLVGARITMLARFPQQYERRVFYSLPDELYRECAAMAQYALERGKSPRADDIRAVHAVEGRYARDDKKPWDEDELESIVDAHRNLSALVAPAMPKTLVLLNFEAPRDADDEYPPSLSWLGTVRLVRMMLGLAMFLVPLFVGLALAIGTRLGTTDGLFFGDFVDKLQSALYLIVAAGLGAAFAALFKARRYIENLSYDDQYESSYWMRFVLGLVAGLILAVVLSSVLPTEPTGTTGSVDNPAFQITVPLLAIIGGFSSDLVYRILRRVIEAIETLIQGSASDQIDSERQNAEARLKAQATENHQLLHAQQLRAQQDEARALITMMNDIAAVGQDTHEVRAAIAKRLEDLLGHSAHDGLAATPQGSSTQSQTKLSSDAPVSAGTPPEGADFHDRERGDMPPEEAPQPPSGQE